MKWLKKLCAAVMAVVALAASVWALATVAAKADVTADITENVSASNWIEQNELRVTYLSLGDGVVPAIGYGIIDNNAYTYVQDYVAINGRTIKEINTDTTLGASGWTYTVFPSTADAKYKLPVIVYVNNGKLEIKIHNNYVERLGDCVEITAKAGLYFENNGTKYEVTEDKTFTVFGKKMDETDITDKVSVGEWLPTGEAAELTYTIIRFPQGVLPGYIDYGVMDKSAWLYIQEYIFLNGESVKQINEETDTSNYVFSTFPSIAADIYKVPVIVYENGNTIEVKFHNDYLQTLEGDKIEITLGEGFSIANGDTKYIVTEDVKQTVLQITETQLTGITVNGWAAAGDAMELTYTRVQFPKGLLPGSIDYDVLDKSAWMYLQQYIYLNGKSIKQINEETDTSNYVFSTFPSTADVKYKLPVIIFENGDALELKFHNDYLQTLEGDLEITIKAGLYILEGATKYVVKEDICYQLSGDIWSDKNRIYTVTYYVNGEVYGEIEQYPYKSAVVLRENVTAVAGYQFSGWEYTATDGIIQDMEIRGYIKPIRYTITYHLDGGINDSTNPIFYYVTDGEILLKDATKEGAIFKGWYTSQDYTTKVEKLSPDSLGEMQLYALFEETAENKGGCGSIVGAETGLFALVGMAFLLKKKNDE